MENTEYRLNSIEEKLEEAKSAQDTLTQKIDKISSWLTWATAIGVAAGAAIAILYGIAWNKLPQKAIEKAEIQIQTKVQEYLESNDIRKGIQLVLDEHDQKVSFRTGTISPSDWNFHKPAGIWAEVKIDLTKYADHKIFLTLKGDGRHWEAYGPSVYPFGFPNEMSYKEGFRAYILQGENLVDGGENILEVARKKNWTVDWLVIGVVDM